MNILKNQKLEVDNLITLRIQGKQSDLQFKVNELINYAKEQGASKTGNSISTTHSINPTTGEIDIEFYFPIDKIIPTKDNFIFKPKLLLHNCVKVNHKGNPNLLQETCVKLNEYMANEKLVPISTGYNVTIFEVMKQEDIDKFEVDVYVSVSSNIV